MDFSQLTESKDKFPSMEEDMKFQHRHNYWNSRTTVFTIGCSVVVYQALRPNLATLAVLPLWTAKLRVLVSVRTSANHGMT